MVAATVPTFEGGLLLRRSFSLPTGRYDDTNATYSSPNKALGPERRAFKNITTSAKQLLPGGMGGKSVIKKSKKVVVEKTKTHVPAPLQNAATTTTTQHQQRKQLPAWYRSLSQATKPQAPSSSCSSLPASNSVGDFFRTSSSISTVHSNQDVEEYMRNLCCCGGLGLDDDSTMCKRHALRALWKLYFFAFPRKVVNIRNHAAPAHLNTRLLLALMREDCELNQPVASGRDEVIKVLDSFEGTMAGEISAELVHNYVDEEASVTFSEYVLQFSHSGRYLKICEVIFWDLSHYRKGSGDGDSDNDNSAYDRGLLLKGDRPAIRKVMYFGKDSILVPNAQLPVSAESQVPLHLLEKYSNCKFCKAVSGYLDALLKNDLSSVYGMLCSSFRISAFDGVKTRDAFITWLETNCDFKRKVKDVFVDHKAKTAFLHLTVQCGALSAVVLNVVQWNLEAESIIAIREYGTVYKLI